MSKRPGIAELKELLNESMKQLYGEYKTDVDILRFTHAFSKSGEILEVRVKILSLPEGNLLHDLVVIYESIEDIHENFGKILYDIQKIIKDRETLNENRDD